MFQITSFEYNIHQFIELFFSFVDELITIPSIFKFINTFINHLKFTISSTPIFIISIIIHFQHLSRLQWINSLMNIICLVDEFNENCEDNSTIHHNHIHYSFLIWIKHVHSFFSCRKIQCMNRFHFHIFHTLI